MTGMTIAALARELAPLVGADPEKAARAAMLAKADLVSEMVGEFPELQGVMGRYYALRAGETPSAVTGLGSPEASGPSFRPSTRVVSLRASAMSATDTPTSSAA